MTPTPLPAGYTIAETEEYQPRHYKLVVLRNGTRIDETGWHMDTEGASRDAWGHYHGQIASQRNKTRLDEVNHVLAWRLPDGRVYTVDHLDFPVPLGNLEEITIATHSSGYEITNMLCAHCGAGAVDDEILDEHHLLNEGWGYWQ